MKIRNYLMYACIFLGITCSERENIISNFEKDNIPLKPSQPGACDETLPNIRATYLANGTTTTCTNNIMVFATIALYESTIENLETQIEAIIIALIN